MIGHVEPSPIAPRRLTPIAWHLPPPRRRSFALRCTLLLALTTVSLLIAGAAYAPGGETFGIGDLPGHWWSTLLAGLPYALAVLAILGAHEMGHYLACRYYRIPATPPFFIPGLPPLGTFGALIRIRGIIPDRRALFDVAVAGPLAGFVVAVPVLAWGLMRAEVFEMSPAAQGWYMEFGSPLIMHALGALIDPVEPTRMNSFMAAGWLGMLVTSLNLFPVGQLDGGHAIYAVSRRLHRVLAWLTIAGLAGLIAWQALVPPRSAPAYTLWFLILLWMRDRHPPVLDESVEPGPGRRLLALVLLAIFVLTFIAVPIRLVGGE